MRVLAGGALIVALGVTACGDDDPVTPEAPPDTPPSSEPEPEEPLPRPKPDVPLTPTPPPIKPADVPS